MKITDFLLELFYPSRCAFCGKLVKMGEGMCRDCGKKLPYTGENNAQQHFANISICISPLYYEGTVRDALLRYKFGGAASYSRVFGKIMAKCIDEMHFSCDIITWVPLSRARLRKRGYNQAQLLAECVAKELSLPCAEMLVKLRNNPAQSGINDYKQRQKNVSGIYEALAPSIAAGKRILLVDDIVTTGATLSEAASVLRKAGAADVAALTAARRRD
jgi:competence protein ComFC